MSDKNKNPAQVVSLSQKRQAHLTLKAFDGLLQEFDKFLHEEKRAAEEKRAEIEREARNKI